MVVARGRRISRGLAEGLALVSSAPISFYGGVDPETGVVIERGHPLEGQTIAGRVLVFPTGKGSTVGSYTMYRLKKNGKAPVAIVNRECDSIVAVGAIISGIPLVDKLPTEVFGEIRDDAHMRVDADQSIVEIA
jgi:hypothetical protein